MEHDNYEYNAATVNIVLAGVLSNFHCFLKGNVEHVNMKSKSPGKVRLVLHNLNVSLLLSTNSLRVLLPNVYVVIS